MTGPEPGPYAGQDGSTTPQPPVPPGAPPPPPAPQYGAPTPPPQYGTPAPPPQYGTPAPPPQYGTPAPPPQYGAPAPPPQYGPAQYGPPQYGPPQYGPAAYGAPVPPFGQTTPVRNRKPLIFGGIAAAVIVVIIVVVVALVSGGGSPKQVAQDYLNAAKNGDVSTMKSLTCDRYASQVTPDAVSGDSSLGDIGKITFDVVDVTENGDTATAHVKITISVNPGSDLPPGIGGSVTVPLRLVKEHGAWKVCTAP